MPPNATDWIYVAFVIAVAVWILIQQFNAPRNGSKWRPPEN